MSRLSRRGYEELVQGDREWLMQQPRTLERDHVAMILARAVAYEYDADPTVEQTGNLVARWMAAAINVAPVTAAAIAFDPTNPEAWVAAIRARQDNRTLDQLACDAVTAIGEVFGHLDDRTAVTKQLRDLADYAESCIESLNRR